MAYSGSNHSDPTASPAHSSGASLVRSTREARGYSVEDLAVTCGLTVNEIADIEGGNDVDPAKLRRIAHAFTARRLPERAPGGPRTHTYEPVGFSNEFSAHRAPVLVVWPGAITHSLLV